MIEKINKKVTIKMKDGRVFKAQIIGRAGKKIIIESKEHGQMTVDSREVRN